MCQFSNGDAIFFLKMVLHAYHIGVRSQKEHYPEADDQAAKPFFLFSPGTALKIDNRELKNKGIVQGLTRRFAARYN